jgi:hypothetical protein
MRAVSGFGLPYFSLSPSPPTGGFATAIGPDRPSRRYSFNAMTPEQTTDAFDTNELELELAPAAEAPTAENGQDSPIWTPEDGDFT